MANHNQAVFQVQQGKLAAGAGFGLLGTLTASEQVVNIDIAVDIENPG